MEAIDSPPLGAFLSDPGRFAIFGTGEGGRSVAAALAERGHRPDLFLDNAAGDRGPRFLDADVLEPAEGLERGVDTVVLASMYARDMALQLRELGYAGRVLDLSAVHLPRWTGHFDTAVHREHAAAIDACRARLADDESRAVLDALLEYRRTLDNTALPAPSKQYRCDAVPVEADEVVLDVGGFDGDTSSDYAADVGPGGHVHAFEPVASNFADLRALAESGPRGAPITPWQLACWNERTVLHIKTAEPHPMQFRVHPEGDEEIQAVAIDDWAAEHGVDRVGWIKMDIEGAEHEALDGAARVLREQRPKLAICIYHRARDVWELPLKIADLLPDAALHLRHHSQNLYETVCYADPRAS